VRANENCRSNETALDWAIQGPQGPPGPPGPPGTGVTQIDPVTVAGNQSEVLLTAGSFTLTAVCRIDFQPPAPVPIIDQATINVSTTQDNTAVAGGTGAPGREIDPGQTAAVIAPGGPGAEDPLSFATAPFFVLAPDGTRL